MSTLLRDKTFWLFICGSFVSSAVVYFVFSQYLVKDAGIWSAPMFIPIYSFTIVIFVINTLLGFAAYRRDRLISLAFNFSTIAVNLLLIVAMILNLKNPNG